MRKIIVLEHVSLDGVIQAPGGPDEDITRLRSLGRSSGSGFKHSVAK